MNRCPGSNAVPVEISWADRHRVAERIACPVCGARLARKSDGRVRRHPGKSVPAKVVPLQRVARQVTQK